MTNDHADDRGLDPATGMPAQPEIPDAKDPLVEDGNDVLVDDQAGHDYEGHAHADHQHHNDEGAGSYVDSDLGEDYPES